MKRYACIMSVFAFFISVSAFAQQAARRARRPPAPTPLFFREGWKDTPAVPVTQEVVTNPDLELEDLRRQRKMI